MTRDFGRGVRARTGGAVREVMYPVVSGLLIAVGLIAASGAIAGESQPHENPAPVTTVYVSHMGKWYHRENCYYLARTKTAISLEEARRRGLRPCKLCRPPEVKEQK